MNQDVVFGVLALLVLVIVLPSVLSISEHNREKRLAQPIVIFTSNSWKFRCEVIQMLLSAAWGFFFSLVGIITPVYSMARFFVYNVHNVGFVIAVNVVGLVLLVVGMASNVQAILYWNYWRNLGQPSLAFSQAEQALQYTFENGSMFFSTAEVSLLSLHRSKFLRYNVGYTMVMLADGRQMPVPTMLCDFDDLRTLLPVPKVEITSQWLPILPSKPITVAYPV